MVPSLLTAQPVGNTSKAAAPRTDSVFPADAARRVSDRVSAFLASDPTSEKINERAGRRPPPPGGNPTAGRANAGLTAATGNTDNTQLLLKTGHKTGSAEGANQTGPAPSPIVIDEAATYYPTSIY